jgi:hypothetical protein
MSLARNQFLLGLGAFACAGPVRPAEGRIIVSPSLPTVTQVSDLGNQGALYRFWLDIGGAGRVYCTAAALPRRSFAARIVQQPTRQGAWTAVQSIGRSTSATVAINGGRFNGAFAPDGLLIVEKNIVGQKRADWIGYLTIDGDGNAAVTNKPDLRRAEYALQGDPLIIEPGGKMGMMREDGKRFRRTLILQSGDVIFAMVTTPVSLFSLAYGLLERPDALYVNHFDAALNLSGAATTSFYAKLSDGQEVNVPAFWPNRDVVTFTPRLAGA